MVQRYYQATSSTGCPAYFRSLFVRKSFGIFGAKTVQVDNSVGVGPVPRGRWGVAGSLVPVMLTGFISARRVLVLVLPLSFFFLCRSPLVLCYDLRVFIMI